MSDSPRGRCQPVPRTGVMTWQRPPSTFTPPRSARRPPRSWFGCRPGHGVRLGGHAPVARGPGMRELGAEEHDQGRVIDPHQQHHHRPGRAVGRAHARVAEVIADGGFAEVKRTAVMTPPGHTSRQRISASGTYVNSRAKSRVRTSSETAISRRRLRSACSGPQKSAAAPARAALTTSETRSKNASAKTRASEKTRALSQAQSPAQTPLGGGGPDLPDEVHRRLELAEDRCRANDQGDEADDGGPRAPLRARGGENAGHELPARRAHEAFELGGQLTWPPVPVRAPSLPRRRGAAPAAPGTGGIVRQGRREPQAVVLPPVLRGAYGHAPEALDPHGSPPLESLSVAAPRSAGRHSTYGMGRLARRIVMTSTIARDAQPERLEGVFDA